MDHVVYLDAKADELEKMIEGSKTMIIRGATGRKMPYGRVNRGDVLYFINNNAEGSIKAKGRVLDVFNSDRMSKEESEELVRNNQGKLQLDDNQFQRWAGKRYIVLIGLADVTKIEPFSIDRSAYGNMDDWLPVGDIKSVKEV